MTEKGRNKKRSESSSHPRFHLSPHSYLVIQTWIDILFLQWFQEGVQNKEIQLQKPNSWENWMPGTLGQKHGWCCVFIVVGVPERKDKELGRIKKLIPNFLFCQHGIINTGVVIHSRKFVDNRDEQMPVWSQYPCGEGIRQSDVHIDSSNYQTFQTERSVLTTDAAPKLGFWWWPLDRCPEATQERMIVMIWNDKMDDIIIFMEIARIMNFTLNPSTLSCFYFIFLFTAIIHQFIISSIPPYVSAPQIFR